MFEAQAAEHGGEPPGLEHVEHTAHGAEGGLPNPMHQFEIKRLIPFEWFGFDASFTNSALFMFTAVVIITAFLVIGTAKKSLVPSRLQSAAELSYEFVATTVRSTAWRSTAALLNHKGCISPAIHLG